MRTIKWLVGFAVAGTTAGMIASGCSGDDNVAPSQDSGSDHTTADTGAPPEAAAEAGVDSGGPDAPACMTDADLSTLNVPDAEIGDSGAFAPVCYSCIETTCAAALAACSADCVCNVGVQMFIACVATPGMNAISCGTALATSGNANAAALEACVGGPIAQGPPPGCLNECGVNLGGGPEGGPPDGAAEGGGEGGGGEAGGGDGGSEGGDATSE
jgi:hypothetical protein